MGELQAGGKVMVTTFLCPKDTPKPVLKALYRQRWNIAAVKEKARAIFRNGASLPQDALIRRLNPVLQGWGN